MDKLFHHRCYCRHRSIPTPWISRSRQRPVCCFENRWFNFEVSFRDSLYTSTRKQSLLVHSYKWYKTLDRVTSYLPFYRSLSHASSRWDACVLQRSTRRLLSYEKG